MAYDNRRPLPMLAMAYDNRRPLPMLAMAFDDRRTLPMLANLFRVCGVVAFMNKIPELFM
jgi:hypothetical protein